MIPGGILVMFLLGAVAIHYASRFAYQLGWKHADERRAVCYRALEQDPALGISIWRRMVSQAIEAGTLPASALTTTDILQFNRLPEDDQKLIAGAGRAVFSILASAPVRVQVRPESTATPSPPDPPIPAT